MARGKEVIVSRGELIEIGGAFRIPDVMAASGAILREVGTTNRTHLRDYAEAIHENTGLLLKVHPSNYKILGFTSTPSMEELTELGAQHGIPTMEDLGSGALIDMTTYGLPHEPLVGERIASGVDIVTFSGDKLLGGPQAGIIVGKAEWIEKMRKNPMMRALRVDKLIIAGLSATLQLYLTADASLTERFPMLNRYTRSIAALHTLATELKAQLETLFGEKVNIQVSETYGQIGSGHFLSRRYRVSHLSLNPQKLPPRGSLPYSETLLFLSSVESKIVFSGGPANSLRKRTGVDTRNCYTCFKRFMRITGTFFILILTMGVYACGHSEEGSSTTENAAEIVSAVDGARMVLIPAGTFQMGSTTGDSDEHPVHTVTLDAFYMDMHEVTNARYQQFVQSTGYPQPPLSHNPRFNSPDAPVVRVNWRDAVAYAAWAHKRLPTEAEWEYAARGGLTGKQYPNGDIITYKDANFGNIGGADQWKWTAPVGQLPTQRLSSLRYGRQRLGVVL